MHNLWHRCCASAAAAGTLAIGASSWRFEVRPQHKKQGGRTTTRCQDERQHKPMRIVVRDQAALDSKLRSFTRQNVVLIADFDNTLTENKTYDMRNKRDDCHRVIMNSPLLPDAFRTDMQQLFIAGSQPSADKDALFDSLWRRSNQLMVDYGLQRNWLHEMVCSSTTELRRGTQRLVAAAAAGDVPVLIFSAGIKQVILECFSQGGLQVSEDLVLANSMHFDDEGVLVSWQEPTVHVHNKSLTLYPHLIRKFHGTDRATKIVLLGDQVGDLSMAHGLPLDMNRDIIAIGLVNDQMDGSEHVANQVARYSELFDVVLVGDGPIDFAVELLENICAQDKSP
eukprot:TRINITY_DN47116_c0_g1_i1.p1 TRINITY_DN47116_c0_g1~~TRINITY_DN47116_c0_g1_i1.p1  ORF type:complete len:339 (-),score=51.45 TRINITY_DN47116_c0_g1_i1:175-1191(-)